MEVTSLKDMDGWPIVIGCRARSVTVFKSGKKSYKHGEVVGINGENVEIKLFKNLHIIVVPSSTVKVMKGKTRNQFQYELIKEKFRRRK